MTGKLLFSSYDLGGITLPNRMVMAPMTRSRSIGNVPGESVATYYAQRAEAGLIITEGTAPCPNGLGYPRIPGVYSAEQAAGWREVTRRVHERGGHIFVQLMHTGRVSHPHNMPDGAHIVAPSAVRLDEKMFTDQAGPQPHPEPEPMTEADIQQAIDEYAAAATLAVEAGFDGVELHGANGYLIDQFLNLASNQRTDRWGKDVEGRCRFAVEVARAVAERIGTHRLGIRLSPYGVFNGMSPDDQMDAVYEHLTDELSTSGLLYIHLVDHSAMGAPQPPPSLVHSIREKFSGKLILSGGYDAERAEADLQENHGDLVAFGRPFLANPNLVTRYREGRPLNQPDFDTFYTPGEKGYTDYPLD